MAASAMLPQLDINDAEGELSVKKMPIISRDSNLNYIDLLFKYYEENPIIGKPFYNSRTINEQNFVYYKSQLIVGANVAVSNVHQSRFDADNEAAKTILSRIIPIENLDFNIASNESRKRPHTDEIESNLKENASENGSAMLDIDIQTNLFKHNSPPSMPFINTGAHLLNLDDDVYYSDDEKVPSYQHLLNELLQKRNLRGPKFSYEKGKLGILCNASIALSGGVEQIYTSLREHAKQENAREDICHDLYIIVNSQPM